MPAVFRFAPSPNGYLHLGHALSALLNADMARAAGGRLLLRIEDIDATRCRPEYEAAIYEDLRWLGLASEEPVRRQSEHFADYSHALDQLEAMGIVYPSFESRAEIAALSAGRDPDGAPLYPGTAKTLSVTERRDLIGPPTRQPGHRHPLFQLAFPANRRRHARGLVGTPLADQRDVVEGVGDLAADAGQVVRHADRKVALLEREHRGQQRARELIGVVDVQR